MSFAAPAVLIALAALPAIWWLLRLTPPRPRVEAFPPARLAAEIPQKSETSARTPWWLTALRLLLTAIVILALAGPNLTGSADEAPGEGPLLLIVDNGWTSAPNWEATREAALAISAMASEAERPVALVATAEGPGQVVPPTDADEIAARVEQLEPRPYAPAPESLLPVLSTIAATADFGGVAWISDGLENAGTDALIDFLRNAVDGPVTIYRDLDAGLFALLQPDNAPEGLTVGVVRPIGGAEANGTVVARDLRGRAVGEAAFQFAPGETGTEALFDLPTELRNEIIRLEIDGAFTAGAVQLLDDRYRRKSVAIISSEIDDQPLLSARYYLTRALAPFAEVSTPAGEANSAIGDAIASGASVIILDDIGVLSGEIEGRLEDWIANGGMLIRFAGPRLAEGTPALAPVTLREGGRTLGGALQWDEPQPLGAFPDESPFAGLTVPGDVLVEQQVLAEPNADLPERTWAALADGTPLVTGARTGSGVTVLFHVTGDTSWSNLPLSGVFVEMLRRLLAMTIAPAAALETASTAALAPYRLLDGYGRFVDPGADAEPLQMVADTPIDAAHPPGLYGDDEAFRALNLLGLEAPLTPLDISAIEGAAASAYPGTAPTPLAPWLFVVAFLLLLADSLAVLWLSGSFDRRSAQAATAVLGALLVIGPLIPQHDARAQDALTDADRFALMAANRTSLAYVLTGDPVSDEIARAGLAGLSWILTQRTSFEPGDPIGVDISNDELAFFPILYWRVTADAPMPEPGAIVRLVEYMQNGGVVLFDTADQLQRTGGAILQTTTAAGDRLRAMLQDVDIPPLEPVPGDHVLTKTYYLLDSFPGRFAGGDMWVEMLPPAEEGVIRPARPADGVSPILITSNDLAAAWAINDTGAFLFPMLGTDPRQREFAFRAGINLVMYALTGNYKTDQVHIPDLLERLGQ